MGFTAHRRSRSGSRDSGRAFGSPPGTQYPSGVTRVERFQLDVPEDFPAGELGAVYEHVGDTGDRTQTVEWGEWAGACNGIAYRFLALDEHAISLSESLDEAVAPPMPERCRQERLLFSFFSEGLSCLECSYYGFYFVGAMVDEGSFNPMADRRAITPSFVTKRYEARFHNEPPDTVNARY